MFPVLSMKFTKIKILKNVLKAVLVCVPENSLEIQALFCDLKFKKRKLGSDIFLFLTLDILRIVIDLINKFGINN